MKKKKRLVCIGGRASAREGKSGGKKRQRAPPARNEKSASAGDEKRAWRINDNLFLALYFPERSSVKSGALVFTHSRPPGGRYGVRNGRGGRGW